MLLTYIFKPYFNTKNKAIYYIPICLNCRLDSQSTILPINQLCFDSSLFNLQSQSQFPGSLIVHKVSKVSPYPFTNLHTPSSFIYPETPGAELGGCERRLRDSQPSLLAKNWLIFITFQSAIKINQFQFRSFFAHFWPKYQGYSLTFWPKLAHFHHFSICNQYQSISISVVFRSFLAKYQGYSLTVWPKLAHFHHFSICSQNQSISISVIFGQNTKAIAFLFGQNWLIFITFQFAIRGNSCLLLGLHLKKAEGKLRL